MGAMLFLLISLCCVRFLPPDVSVSLGRDPLFEVVSDRRLTYSKISPDFIARKTSFFPILLSASPGKRDF